MNKEAAQSVYNLIKELEKPKPEQERLNRAHNPFRDADGNRYPDTVMNMLRTLPMQDDPPDHPVDAVQFNYAAYVRGEFADPVQPHIYKTFKRGDDGIWREPKRNPAHYLGSDPKECQQTMRKCVQQKEEELYNDMIRRLNNGDQLTKYEQDFIFHYNLIKNKRRK